MDNALEKSLNSYRRDSHFNLFISYGGNYGLENNITRALIIVLNEISCEEKCQVLEQLIPSLQFHKGEKYTFEFYLQTSPSAQIKSLFSLNQKYMFGFCPSGRAWKTKNLSSGSPKEIKAGIREAILLDDPDIDKSDLETKVEANYKDDMLRLDSRGGSIPDAWILIYENDKAPFALIACENKLIDLNPFQLRNHRLKSLGIDDLKQKGNKTDFASYRDIVSCLLKINERISSEFIVYLMDLKKFSVTNLSEIPDVSNDIVLDASRDRILSVMQEIKPDAINKSKWRAATFHLNDECFGDPQLCFYPDSGVFYCGVYIATKMSKAKSFFLSLKNQNISDAQIKGINLRVTFHLQDVYGNNLGGTYRCSLSIKEYLYFWMRHASSLHRIKGQAELFSYLDWLVKEGGLKLDDAKDIKLAVENGHRTTFSVIPELGASKTWSLDEAKKADKEGRFVSEVKEFINSVLVTFHRPTI